MIPADSVSPSPSPSGRGVNESRGINEGRGVLGADGTDTDGVDGVCLACAVKDLVREIFGFVTESRYASVRGRGRVPLVIFWLTDGAGERVNWGGFFLILIAVGGVKKCACTGFEEV